jgi:transposase InsO family protein
LAVSSATPAWIEEIANSYEQDEKASELVAKLSVTPSDDTGFALNNGLLRYKGKIWVGNVQSLKTKIMHALHSGPLGGHSGIPVTIRRIKQYFVWSGLTKDVQTFVSTFQICQQAKPERVKYPGLLQPLPIPECAWQVLSLDFVEGLPLSKKMNVVLVVVDKFSKYHFLPLAHPFTALSVAQLYMQQVYRLHGMPKSMISDRDRIFTSSLWQLLFKLSGVDLKMSTSYHPQTDGQTERVNQCMETFLRCFVSACPTQWSSWIHLAEFWYNTSWHSALGRSPFEVLYGYAPRVMGVEPSDAAPVPLLEDWLLDRSLMQDLIKQHLARAQERMKCQADKNRTERSFDVGDSVYLKLQPYVQSCLAPRANQKLAFKFFGPFTIEEKIGAVAYKLALPPTSSIHPVFHVSQLKRAVPSGCQVTPVVPNLNSGLQVPSAILQKRLSADGDLKEVLVQWSGWPSSLATWRTLRTFVGVFLVLQLGDKLFLSEGGCQHCC